MQLIDVKFDGGEGDANAVLHSGVITITLNESNPNFPSGALINIPLDTLFAAIKPKVPVYVSWMLSGIEALIDAIP